MKRIAILGATLALCVSSAWAQNKCTEQCDTIVIDTCTQQPVAQVPLNECQAVDTCENARFAIVTKNNRQGIYDLRKGRNVTPIAYEGLSYYECEVTEWGVPITHFLAYRGTELGRIAVEGDNDKVFEVWSDNPELVASLTYCTTIDDKIMEQCKQTLSNGLPKLQGTHGQVAVIDVQTGQLKAWVAMQNDKGSVTETKLLKKACGSSAMLPLFALKGMQKAGLSLTDSIDVDNGIYHVNDTLTIRDHNWRWGGYDQMSIHDALTHHSKVAMYKLAAKGFGIELPHIWQMAHQNNSNAMELAIIINAICSQTALREPTLIGDSLNVTPINKQDKAIGPIVRTLLADMNVGDALQAKYAPRGVKISGLYSFNAKPLTNEREFMFAGAIPAEKPRYAIGVFVDTPQNDTPHYAGDLAKWVVNPLVEWLTKQ